MLINSMIAGFGGQGVLFTGKIIAHAALSEGKEVSWLPSYGPEMRGGTANCSICIDSEPIGCPLVLEPDLLIAMNQPSYEKFLKSVVSGGTIIYDSSLIQNVPIRTDVKAYPIPATELATEQNLEHFANLILLGYTFQKFPLTDVNVVRNAISDCIPSSKKHLLEPNLKAFELGLSYQG